MTHDRNPVFTQLVVQFFPGRNSIGVSPPINVTSVCDLKKLFRIYLSVFLGNKYRLTEAEKVHIKQLVNPDSNGSKHFRPAPCRFVKLHSPCKKFNKIVPITNYHAWAQLSHPPELQKCYCTFVSWWHYRFHSPGIQLFVHR